LSTPAIHFDTDSLQAPLSSTS